ncbi:hypothetical protein B0H14DRAFT_3172837 [Mycena olivaceomarginata]|nr:hypothetical protein B0H14DRAFT_3172837 [Mycena olivaceomarginata]
MKDGRGILPQGMRDGVERADSHYTRRVVEERPSEGSPVGRVRHAMEHRGKRPGWPSDDGGGSDGHTLTADRYPLRVGGQWREDEGSQPGAGRRSATSARNRRVHRGIARERTTEQQFCLDEIFRCQDNGEVMDTESLERQTYRKVMITDHPHNSGAGAVKRNRSAGSDSETREAGDGGRVGDARDAARRQTPLRISTSGCGGGGTRKENRGPGAGTESEHERVAEEAGDAAARARTRASLHAGFYQERLGGESPSCPPQRLGPSVCLCAASDPTDVPSRLRDHPIALTTIARILVLLRHSHAAPCPASLNASVFTGTQRSHTAIFQSEVILRSRVTDERAVPTILPLTLHVSPPDILVYVFSAKPVRSSASAPYSWYPCGRLDYA